METKNFNFLWEAHVAKLYSFVRCSCRTTYDADDVVQMVTIDALKGFGTLRKADSFYPWIYGIAKHKISDFYKSQKEYCLLDSSELIDFLDKREQKSNADLCNSIVISDFIHSLPGKWGDALALSIYFGENIHYISKVMGYNYAKTRYHLAKLKRQLAQQLKEE